MAGEAKAFEDALVFGLQRIEACADHPCNGLLKRLAETAVFSSATCWARKC